MRSERPLGTWCGYKQTGEAHGETEKKPALVVGTGKEGRREEQLQQERRRLSYRVARAGAEGDAMELQP